MRILHCCLSCFYIDDFTYQENLLTQQNAKDGHEVKIIASTETFINSELGYVKPSKYMTKEGIEVTRIPYRKIFPHLIAKKIRSYPNVYKMIEQFSPDVILFHGVPAYELLTAVKYKKRNPKVKLYVDSHEDFHNSGTNFISKQFLHKTFYRAIVQKTFPYIDKIFCINYESIDFLKQMYGIPESLLEFYPLGGNVVEESVRDAKRKQIREELKLNPDDILIVHSGKMDKRKRTEDLLEAFTEVTNEKLKLVLIGSMPNDVKENSMRLVSSDHRIRYLGWKSGEQLIDYLYACDLYLQPGTQSATMQNALCCGSAAALYPYPSHKYLLGDSVFYVESTQDMRKLFEEITDKPYLIENKRAKASKIAKEVLDYKVLASRLYK
jgi:Glycosyltransferase